MRRVAPRSPSLSSFQRRLRFGLEVLEDRTPVSESISAAVALTALSGANLAIVQPQQTVAASSPETPACPAPTVDSVKESKSEPAPPKSAARQFEPIVLFDNEPPVEALSDWFSDDPFKVDGLDETSDDRTGHGILGQGSALATPDSMPEARSHFSSRPRGA